MIGEVLIDRRFGVQLSRYLLLLFVQDARSGTEHRWVTVPFCYRVDEPVNLALEFAEPQFEVSPSGIRLGRKTFPLIVISMHVFGNHAWMPHLGLQPDKNSTFHGRKIECLCVPTRATLRGSCRRVSPSQRKKHPEGTKRVAAARSG
jgi:hypothetical protein